MSAIKEFIDANGIKQKDLAAFLGIGEPSVSKMVKGFSRPSKENLRKLLENTNGWDCSMLVSGSTSINQRGRNNIIGSGCIEEASAISCDEQVELIRLRAENDLLRGQLEWAMKTIDRLTEK